jgi:hypothetical protein
MISHVERAVAERIAAARRREAEKQQQRAEFAAARAVGVARRHAQKLARSQQDPATNPEDTPMANTPFRNLPCPSCRAQRTVRRVSTTTVSRVAYDVVRCPQDGCELLWLTPSERPRTAPVAA